MPSQKVHTFPLIGAITPEYRVPFQYVASGNYQPRAFTLAALLAWIEANIELSNSQQYTVAGPSLSLPVTAGKWAMAVAFESATGQTFRIGTTPGGSEYGEVFIAGGSVGTVPLNIFGGTGGAAVYLSGITASTIVTILLL